MADTTGRGGRLAAEARFQTHEKIWGYRAESEVEPDIRRIKIAG